MKKLLLILLAIAVVGGGAAAAVIILTRGPASPNPVFDPDMRERRQFDPFGHLTSWSFEKELTNTGGPGDVFVKVTLIKYGAEYYPCSKVFYMDEGETVKVCAHYSGIAPTSTSIEPDPSHPTFKIRTVYRYDYDAKFTARPALPSDTSSDTSRGSIEIVRL